MTNFPLKRLVVEAKRRLLNRREPANAQERELLQKQLQREMDLEREMIRHRGGHGGGP